MPLAPTSSSLVDAAQEVVSSAWSKLEGLFGHQHFSPSVSLDQTPGIDPRFLPRVPMVNSNLDVHLLGELGKMGMKRGKEITPATHPEFHREWVSMCQRAGLTRVPQLILAESKALNAASFTGENAVVVTSGLMQRMNFREVRAVLGHELGHEVSDHTSSRILATIGFAGGAAVVGDSLARGGGIGSVAKLDEMKPGRLKNTLQYLFNHDKKALSLIGSAFYVVVGWTLGSIIANQLTVRPTELDADKKGALISGDPEALISALTKLEENHGKFSIVKAFRKLKSGYPSMETRIERLREVARTMPPQPIEQTPVMMPQDMATTPAHAAPTQQIHAISEAQRMGAPAQAPLAAL